MRKIFILSILLACSLFHVKAQSYVNTSVQNRNVVLEEFTGRTCGFCPDGHRIANQIMTANPNRVWAVNIHSEGYFSPTSFPNLNTTKGNTIRANFGATSFPSGVVNRSTSSPIDRGQWTTFSNNELGEVSEANVGGIVIIDSVARIATITVEVYYTGNSSTANNKLTVMMLQDSIMGSQSGSSSNPSQVINGQYCHMHILRDIITDTWGETISPTTQGTFITRTYTYNIPASIGSPNGVNVVIPHIEFLAFVSEDTPNRTNILTANMLTNYYSIAPYIHQTACQPSTLDINENTNLSVTVKNSGAEPTTTNSTVTLTCSNSNLTIVDGTGTVGPMATGATATVSDGFTVKTSTNVEDGTVFPMTITVSNGSDTWNSSFNLTVNTAELGYANSSPTQIGVGENVNLNVQVENTGSIASNANATVTLTCSDPLMTIVDGEGSVNNVSAGGNASVQGGFTIKADPSTSNGHSFTMTMAINYKGRTFTDNFTITVSAPCNAPTNLAATVEDYFNVVLNWNATSEANEYIVYRDNTEIGTTTEKTYTDSDLEDGTYIYTVKSVCSNGTSNASNQASAGIVMPCGTPSNLDGEYQWNSGDEYGVLVEFDAPEVIPHHYNIYRSTSNNNYQIVAEVESADAHVTYFDAGEIACYYYQVTAYYEFGERVCESSTAGAITPGVDYIRICVTDVEENAESKVSIYPNPASKDLTFNNKENGEVSVMIYDLQGKEILTFTFVDSKTIDVESLPSGVYFVKMVSNTTMIKRIVVK